MRKTLKVVAFGGGPADAFIKAAGITDSTQQTAIKTLVNDLNGYGLWTKMKAIYPMVGGNATAHSYNLKDTTKFQIAFSGGWTHSSTGALPNGTNAYADSNLNVLSNLSQNSTHLSVYIRTNNSSNEVAIAASRATAPILNLFPNFSDLSYFRVNSNTDAGFSTGASHLGLWVANRISSNETRNYRNTTRYVNSTSSTGLINQNVWLASSYDFAGYYSNQFAFASIGDGLSDTEAANLYTSIQKFQTTLNRFVGTPIVSDSDAQTFLNTASITDLTQANAVNTLVTDLKGANLWTKMKAVYPMVGGTASTHKFNLKDPRDLDAAFRLSFNGGWTHSSTGALPNGSNGYANTFLTPSVHSSQNSSHLSFYSRTNLLGSGMDIGQIQTIPDLRGFHMGISYSGNSNQMRTRLNSANASTSYTPTDTRGLFSISRINSSEFKGYRNSSNVFTFTESSNTPGNVSMTIGCINTTLGQSDYASHECAFATIGDGLTDTDASNLYTIIQNYQTILNRQV